MRGGTDWLWRLWSVPQRQVLIGILLLIVGWLALEIHRRPVFYDDPSPIAPFRANEVADRIDPNTADLATLKALPSMGERRAKDILAYRQHVLDSGRDTIAFRTSFDLLKVKGIGSGMLATLKPFLTFPDEPPATTQ